MACTRRRAGRQSDERAAAVVRRARALEIAGALRSPTGGNAGKMQTPRGGGWSKNEFGRSPGLGGAGGRAGAAPTECGLSLPPEPRTDAGRVRDRSHNRRRARSLAAPGRGRSWRTPREGTPWCFSAILSARGGAKRLPDSQEPTKLESLSPAYSVKSVPSSDSIRCRTTRIRRGGRLAPRRSLKGFAPSAGVHRRAGGAWNDSNRQQPGSGCCWRKSAVCSQVPGHERPSCRSTEFLAEGRWGQEVQDAPRFRYHESTWIGSHGNRGHEQELPSSAPVCTLPGNRVLGGLLRQRFGQSQPGL